MGLHVIVPLEVDDIDSSVFERFIDDNSITKLSEQLLVEDLWLALYRKHTGIALEMAGYTVIYSGYFMSSAHEADLFAYRDVIAPDFMEKGFSIIDMDSVFKVTMVDFEHRWPEYIAHMLDSET